MTIAKLLDSDQLTAAIEAATRDVKSKPLEQEPRVVLAQLVCFRGDYDRADQLIDAAGKMKGIPSAGIALLRQLLRGEVARQQWFQEGKPPSTRAEPEGELVEAIGAVVELRAGDAAAAAAKLQAGAAQRPARKGVAKTVGGKEIPFDEFRDLNDTTAGVAELYSALGKFYWAPWTDFQSVRFEPVKTLRDLLWRGVTLVNQAGDEEHYFMPCLYADSATASDEALQLGHGTDWKDLGSDLMAGVGQRMFLLGEEVCGILELESIQFEAAV